MSDDIARRAVAAAQSFEGKKDRMAQVQSGDWKITFTVAAADMPQGLLLAAMGTRYQLVAVEVDENEEPVQQAAQGSVPEIAHFDAAGNPVPSDPLDGLDRAKSEAHRITAAIAMACNTRSFADWLAENYRHRWLMAVLDQGGGRPDSPVIPGHEIVAAFVRDWCGVASRREIPERLHALEAWKDLHGRYLDWLRVGPPPE